ncbi:MAG: iron ABC transporter permease [Thermomicrobiales bacterium]
MGEVATKAPETGGQRYPPSPGRSGSILRASVRQQSAQLIDGGSYGLLIGVLSALLLVSVLVGISIGAVSLPLCDVWTSIARHLTGGVAAMDDVNDRIIWEFRTPRVLLAGVVGAGLSVAGTVLQALVRNPLADPYVLGVSSGASLAAVAVILLGSAALLGLGVSLAAFLGAIGAMLAVMALGQRSGRFSPTRLILAGVAIGALCSAATSYLQIKAQPQQLQGVLFWLLGSVAGADWQDLGVPSAAVLVTSGWLLLQARPLNALLMGEESATALGVDVNRFRLQLVIVSSLLTGAVVAVSGGIGFVGLMIPHVARMLVGPDHRRVLPTAVLLGASYLILVDLAARTLQRPVELPLGIFTASIGAPFFIWLMRRTTRLGGA